MRGAIQNKKPKKQPVKIGRHGALVTYEMEFQLLVKTWLKRQLVKSKLKLKMPIFWIGF
jgi:hypothetical protein